MPSVGPLGITRHDESAGVMTTVDAEAGSAENVITAATTARDFFIMELS
jgi:hypothetical protein